MGGIEEVSIVGEKWQRSSQNDDSMCNIQAERGSKPPSYPTSTPEATAKKLGLEVEVACDTRAGRKGWLGTEVRGQQEMIRSASSCRMQTNKSVT